MAHRGLSPRRSSKQPWAAMRLQWLAFSQLHRQGKRNSGTARCDLLIIALAVSVTEAASFPFLATCFLSFNHPLRSKGASTGCPCGHKKHPMVCKFSCSWAMHTETSMRMASRCAETTLKWRSSLACRKRGAIRVGVAHCVMLARCQACDLSKDGTVLSMKRSPVLDQD